jgi:hypothetical protein
MSQPADLNFMQHRREDFKCGFLFLVTCLKKEFHLTTTVEIYCSIVQGTEYFVSLLMIVVNEDYNFMVNMTN